VKDDELETSREKRRLSEGDQAAHGSRYLAAMYSVTCKESAECKIRSDEPRWSLTTPGQCCITLSPCRRRKLPALRSNPVESLFPRSRVHQHLDFAAGTMTNGQPTTFPIQSRAGTSWGTGRRRLRHDVGSAECWKPRRADGRRRLCRHLKRHTGQSEAPVSRSANS
jgi:hypothetical protein